ncbi:hypothetical protein [Marinobacterium sp. xm-d-530]|uniref:hypothetical protein n=1 Tax=Marinobacterium sp. xm-d-530 TaxID=2497747 RepID=UPI00156A434E|nr:hypothetical protein [Marinobacterium sp. xm-d-530]
MLSRLFPKQKRDFTAKRYLSISLRTLHLFGIAGFAGFFLYDLPESLWRPYAILALTTGSLMLLVELYVDAIWFIQLRGLAVITKIFLLLLAMNAPHLTTVLFCLIVIISGYFSHAPGKVRYYSPLLGRVVKSSAELSFNQSHSR